MTSGMTLDGDLADVSDALIARFGEVPVVGGGTLDPVAELEAWEKFPCLKTLFDVPALLIKPDPAKDRDYQGTFSGLTKYSLRIELHADATDDEAAHRELSLLVSKRGPIIARLRDDEIRDALWDLCGMDIALSDGRGWRLNRRKRLQADIGLVLGCN